MAQADHIERVFLGADGPALHRAADWLVGSFEHQALGAAMVVVPGGRAKRRLMELLAQRSAGHALLPPKVVTLGELATRLLPSGVGEVAGPLASLLGWAEVLREGEDELVERVVPEPPGRDDWPGWWALAEQVRSAAEELGAHCMRMKDVAERAAHDRDELRWRALSEFAERYRKLLSQRDLVDLHDARLNAIEAGTCVWPGPVVLVAAADLAPLQEAMLGCLDSPVYALIAAANEDAEGFNRFGGLVPAYWNSQAIAIDDGSISFVDGPDEQATAVLHVLSEWTGREDLSAGEVTVGLGDESLSGPIGRKLEQAGVPVRIAHGRLIGETRPVQLLRALAAFAEGLRFDALAALLRHPDAEGYAAAQSGEPTGPWLTLLDRYASEHLAARPTGGWLGDADRVQAMDAVFAAARSLLPGKPGVLRALGHWADDIGRALAAVYGGRRLNRFAEDDRPVVEALDQVGAVLDRLSRIDEPTQPHCTYAQAVSLVVGQVSGGVVPEPGGEPAVELVGYLELLLDDGPKLVIAGMNEQHVPAPPRHSALLSEGARRVIGIPGDEHRLARDGYALGCMLGWRDGAHFIAGRRSLAGDPLMPSRLLLKSDNDTLARRIKRFVEGQSSGDMEDASLLTPGDRDLFLIPRPNAPPEPINKLRVTAFRDYLACPYRFYLKHVLRIEPSDDRALELSAGGFGTLAHQALRVLAQDDMLSVDDPQSIGDRLSQSLDHVFAKHYGSDAPAAAQVQAELLRGRLRAFAPVHASSVAEGWRIRHVEARCEVPLQIDGQPFTMTGQIDRIDYHAELGYRLIDYKTSDTAKPPENTHRGRVAGVAQWVDLQLPLYLDLSRSLGVNGAVELGYINLPKKPEETAYVAALWGEEELAQARAQRDAVVRSLRAGVFWPPKDVPVFDDGLGALCGDAVADREALINASGGGDR